ncbi:MAG: type II secretion system protein [Verrucomicrobiota bacterium]
MNAARSGHAFTMIELLIVIGLLGALATLMLPSLKVTRTEAMDPIVHKEMQDIRLAFQRFYQDVIPNDSELDAFRKYGLAPLMVTDVNGIQFLEESKREWDDDRQRGWRGPYLDPEGTRTLSGVDDVPVILDPYSDESDDEHFYRVLCPGSTGNWDYDNLGLVFIGTDDADQLDTTPRTSPDTSKSEWADIYFDRSADTTEIIKKLVIDHE